MLLLHRSRQLTAPLLLLSAWGWLELLHPVAVPGPRLADTLPLYEGARHDALPLVSVVAVWLVVATLACLPFRPRLARLAAALLGASVFAVALVVQGAELELARQASVGIDVRGAAATSFPWLAAGLCSLVALGMWSRARPLVDDCRDTTDG